MSDEIPVVPVRLHGLASGGDAVGRDENGRVVFVRKGAPDEDVSVRITRAKKGFAFGEIVSIEQPSKSRIESVCSAFVTENCGGCQWLHIDRKTQLRAKFDIVSSELRKVATEIDEVLAVSPDLGWRRKVRLHWNRPRRDKTQTAKFGFFATQSHTIIPFSACPQLDPALEKMVKLVIDALERAVTGKGELEIVLGTAEEVHVALQGHAHVGALKELANHEKIVGIKYGKQVFGKSVIALAEGGFAGAQHFVQASAQGNKTLRQIVSDAAHPRDGLHILELHAGGGNFTTQLAVGAKKVVAVDLSVGKPTAPNVQTIRGDVEEVLDRQIAEARRFDWVVLDPPRTGVKDLMPKIAKLNPSGIVYVSCNPATLARDCMSVADSYTVERVHVVDMMPQTSHIECVALLKRKVDIT